MASADDPDERREARDRLIEIHRGFAEHLASRFRNRGEPLEDLCQVAVIGLIKAIDGFDVNRGTSFESYAVPTVLGELRRHFRDKGWNVRVPRRLQELRAELAAATESLTHELGREPTAADLATCVGTTEAEVREGMSAAQAYSAVSLQRPLGQRSDGATLGDVMGDDEHGYDCVDTCQTLRSVLPRLPVRERKIIGLRFYHQLTQSEIAAEMGMSQMHVSRLLSRSLSSLRDELDTYALAG